MSRLRFFVPGAFPERPFLARGGGLWASLSILLRTASWLPRVKAYIARPEWELTPFVCASRHSATVYLSSAAKRL